MAQRNRSMPERRSATSRFPRLRQLGASAPVLATVGVLVGLVVAGVVLPLSSPSRPAFPNFGLVTPVPDRPSPEPAPPEPSPSPSPSPPVAQFARYALAELYDRVFIATVAIGNEADQATDWTVELAYGGDVGELSNFWIEGAPQPGLRRVGDRYVFSSAEDVAPGAEVALNVQLERSGADIAPTTCLLNGERCRIDE